MKKTLTTAMAALLLLITSIASAQTTVTARAGTDSETYRFVEVLHQYDSGLLSGAGYTDAGDPRDYTNTGTSQSAYGGVGYAFNIAGVGIKAIAFVDQANGPAADDAVTRFAPWLLATGKVGRVIGTANYFTFIPTEGDAVQVLEQAKAEYPINTSWLAGVGYSATKVGDGPWEDKPFLTVTRKTTIGNFEVWAQRPAEGASAFQLRYLKTF